jgi:Uma2 family endonuclease
MVAPTGRGILGLEVCMTPRSMSEAEYLAFEDAAAEKHEYINGEVWAMARPAPVLDGEALAREQRAHTIITTHLGDTLRQALEGRPYFVVSRDQPPGVDDFDPDLARVGGCPTDAGPSTHPIALVEVLSQSTEQHDRGAKFAHYRRLTSLQAYVLVGQEPRRIEVFHRTPAGWLLTEAEVGGIRIECLDVVLGVDEVYRGLELLDAE